VREHTAIRQNGKSTGTTYMYFFIYMVLDQLLPSIQPHFFSEWTRTSFEQSLMEFYTIPLEEQLQVASEMLEMGICSSL
jgi:hypothetical protein